MSSEGTSHQKVKVAIVGGGCAAMATAFELTRPQHRGRYEVTVYQQGWRLGGKGASGRGAHHRIEEHGLHLWHGWYENAFGMLRECYAELDRDPRECRIADWSEAFIASPSATLADRGHDGSWSGWTALFPPTPGRPGDGLYENVDFSASRYVARAAALVPTLLDSARVRSPSASPHDAERARTLSPQELAAAISRWLRVGQLSTLVGMIEGGRLLEAAALSLPAAPKQLILALTETMTQGTRVLLESIASSDREAARTLQIIDLILAMIRGALGDGLLTDERGFDVVDDWDFRAWLRHHGASERTLDSTFVRSLYDMVFAYRAGQPESPSLSAAVILRVFCRFFLTYRGALFWKMSAGMGDVVFAPFYEVLRSRGVRFEFFHRLENVVLSDAAAMSGAPQVEALEVSVQAKVKDGGEYQPLIDVAGLPCWPSQPDLDQLAGGRRSNGSRDFESHWDDRSAARRRLRARRDFDVAVLAIGLGAVPQVCREIVARDARWRDMVKHVETAATQAFQIWLRPGLGELGWGGETANVTAYVDPIDTWADMSHLRHEEAWHDPVGSIVYFCGVLPDDGPLDNADVAERQHRRARQLAEDQLRRHMRAVWPAAYDPAGEFRWDLLVDPQGNGQGNDGRPDGARQGRFEGQYWTANVNPSDRYVLALPASQRYRISPLDTGYANLTIAGDWTACGYNVGCVEAAVISGRLAAHAISGAPALCDIVGFDHP